MHNERDNQFSKSGRASEPVMGEPPVWFINALDAIVPGFSRLIIETEFGTSFGRSCLDMKTRELALIASCGALGPAGVGAVRKRIPAALDAGVTRMEILEVLVQVGLCAGLPASIGALQVAAEVFAEIDAMTRDKMTGRKQETAY
jgi:4-carboxymuconolactone decarboxylase